MYKYFLDVICNPRESLSESRLKDRTHHAKKVVSHSCRLVDFAIALVNFVLNLPNGKVIFLRNSNDRRTVLSILHIKTFLDRAG